MKNPFIVDTDWLFARLDDPKTSIVDASWYLPAMNRDGRAEYEAQHIPGAVFFDIDAISEQTTDLPHMLASPETFAREVGKLGIAQDDTIVIYDGAGLFSAARVWWNFRVMGAAKVVILDGGLPEWIAHRLPVEAGTAPIYPKLFVPSLNNQAVVDFATMTRIIDDSDKTILDARPTARFTGEQSEPRKGLRSGHMPNAKSLPATDLIEDGKLRSLSDLEGVFAKLLPNKSHATVTTCGSGVTAAIISLALESAGYTNNSLYDGSWSEWGAHPDAKVVTD